MAQRRTGPDQRRHPRLDGGMVEVKFRRLKALPFGEADVYHAGRLMDVSLGGMLFQTDHAITRGERIEYHISTAAGKTNRDGAGKVVRASRDRDFFYIAVEFIT
jgi:hypothetical protein